MTTRAISSVAAIWPVQMRQPYANVQKVLAQYGATMANIVDEVLFVTDMEAAFAATPRCRHLRGGQHHRANSASGVPGAHD
jgi:enamine deaminase RidA (YjgF/YER057c/UK114 family)